MLLSQLQIEAEWYHQAIYLFIQFFVALTLLFLITSHNYTPFETIYNLIQ